MNQIRLTYSLDLDDDVVVYVLPDGELVELDKGDEYDLFSYDNDEINKQLSFYFIDKGYVIYEGN